MAKSKIVPEVVYEKPASGAAVPHPGKASGYFHPGETSIADHSGSSTAKGHDYGDWKVAQHADPVVHYQKPSSGSAVEAPGHGSVMYPQGPKIAEVDSMGMSSDKGNKGSKTAQMGVAGALPGLKHDA
jgi:hypothetical protein